jgi:hypothetical protein
MRVGEHGHAHFHVGQSLRQRVVDFGSHHLAFAGQHDAQVLALEPRVFEREAEVLADRAEQHRDFFGQFEGLRQEQVVGAQQAPGILQGHHHHGLAARAEVVAAGTLGAAGEVDFEAGLVLADGNAALAAIARHQPLELFDHLPAGKPRDATMRRCLPSLVSTRTTPASALARRIMVPRKRPSSSSRSSSSARLLEISERTCSASSVWPPEGSRSRCSSEAMGSGGFIRASPTRRRGSCRPTSGRRWSCHR